MSFRLSPAVACPAFVELKDLVEELAGEARSTVSDFHKRTNRDLYECADAACACREAGTACRRLAEFLYAQLSVIGAAPEARATIYDKLCTLDQMHRASKQRGMAGWASASGFCSYAPRVLEAAATEFLRAGGDDWVVIED